MVDISLPKQVLDRIEARWNARHGREAKRAFGPVDCRLEQIRAHRNNVQRYRRLLKTNLSDLERDFIERRLSEEIAAARRLAADMPPLIGGPAAKAKRVDPSEIRP